MIVEVRTDLANAAKAEESYFAGHQYYTTNFYDLTAAGFKQSPDVSVRIITANGHQYCIEAFHADNKTEVWQFESYVGDPRQGSCP